jgi:hypothetical protein
MRHSKLDLTMNVYTEPKMLDVAQAVNVLPALPDVSTVENISGRIAPGIAPTPGNPGQIAANTGNDRTGIKLSMAAEVIVGSALPVNEKGPLTIPVNGPSEVGATGLEPVTPSVSFTPSRPAILAEKPLIHRRFYPFPSRLQADAKVAKVPRNMSFFRASAELSALV